jgi:hypothetical protein
MIAQLEKNKPVFIVLCQFPFSWLAQPGTPKKIFDWADKYINDYYTPVGFVDYFSATGWHFFFNDDIKNRTQQPENSLVVLKRKG